MRSIVICCCFFLTACQTNVNNRSNVNNQENIKLLEDKLMSAVVELIDDIAKGKMTLNEGGIKLSDSPLCSYRAPDAVRTVCRIGAIAAFDAAKNGYNGRGYRTLVDIRLDNEIRGLEASVAAQREAVAREQLIQTGTKLLEPTVGSTLPPRPTPTHTMCRPNGSQIWCTTN